MEFLLIDDHGVYVDGLRSALEHMLPGCVIRSAATCAEGLPLLRAGHAAGVDLVLLGLNLPEVALLRAVMDACAGQRVAVLSGIEDSVLALAVLRTGAAGYIPKSSPTEVIIQAILLILAGGIFVPTLLAAAGPGEGSDSPVKLEKFGERARERLIARGLAVRDVDILELLVQGQPNKCIAQALRLSEGTVKVYVTRIMRNLSVRNRTQAAFAIHAARLTREPYQERTA